MKAWKPVEYEFMRISISHPPLQYTLAGKMVLRKNVEGGSDDYARSLPLKS